MRKPIVLTVVCGKLPVKLNGKRTLKPGEVARVQANQFVWQLIRMGDLSETASAPAETPRAPDAQPQGARP